MKTLQNYELKNILCLSLLLGGCTNSIIAEEKVPTVTITNSTGEPIVCALVPTTVDSDGGRVHPSSGISAASFAEKYMMLLFLNDNEEGMLPKVEVDGNHRLFLWVASSRNTAGVAALKTAVYKDGVISCHAPIDLFDVKNAVEIEIMEGDFKEEGPAFHYTARGPVMGTIVRYWKKAKDSITATSRRVQQKAIQYEELTEEKLSELVEKAQQKFEQLKKATRKGAHKVQEKASEAWEATKTKAHELGAKASETGESIKNKAQEAGVAAKDKAREVRDKAQETAEHVKDKANLALEKGKQKAKDVAKKGAQVIEELHEMTFADAGKALGVSAQHIRDVENIASLTREQQTKLVATLQAQVKKAEAELSKVAADAEKNKRIAVATMKKYLEQAQHELENPKGLLS